MMDLFVEGDFTLHSGQKSTWKIDCDALTLSDINSLANMAFTAFMERDITFGEVVGIPSGGLRLAEAMKKFRVLDPDTPRPTLIVDDVFTTGKSMKSARKKYGKNSIGLVIFARQPTPKWVSSIFTYTLGA